MAPVLLLYRQPVCTAVLVMCCAASLSTVIGSHASSLVLRAALYDVAVRSPSLYGVHGDFPMLPGNGGSLQSCACAKGQTAIRLAGILIFQARFPNVHVMHGRVLHLPQKCVTAVMVTCRLPF